MNWTTGVGATSGCFHTHSLCARVWVSWWICRVGVFFFFLFTHRNNQANQSATKHVRTFTPLISPMCLRWEGESKYTKKVLWSGLMYISVREKLLCNLKARYVISAARVPEWNKLIVSVTLAGVVGFSVKQPPLLIKNVSIWLWQKRYRQVMFYSSTDTIHYQLNFPN